ncbi:MAG: dTDP-glucose 4,6-dehydratase [Anaerolineae bacterium]|nr:dTDP-glucose 4,6-dehydratase [Anaerolineae bacterium]
MRNVLVTGGAGFIGSNFIHYLFSLDEEIKVVNLDSLTYAGNLDNLAAIESEEAYAFIKGDICDHQLVLNTLQDHEIDTIVHFAAESHVDRSILQPDTFIKTNIEGTFSLLNAAKTYWLDQGSSNTDRARFHHISTDEVYGSLSLGDPAFNESSPYRPNSPYAASKAAADHLVRAYSRTYQLPITITNCSNNYGPFQFPEKLIPLMISNAKKGEPLPVYGDGQHRRDWLHVEDHCRAIWQVVENGKPGEMYNIGSGEDVSNLDLMHTLCGILDELEIESRVEEHRTLIQHVPDRPGHDFRYAIDISKITRELGWVPQFSLEAGLRMTISWYLENEAWVQKIEDRPTFNDWIKQNYAARGEKR